jgi:hypothetical protein
MILGAKRCAVICEVAQKAGSRSQVPDKDAGMRWSFKVLADMSSGTNHVDRAYVIPIRVQQMPVPPHRFTCQVLHSVKVA